MKYPRAVKIDTANAVLCVQSNAMYLFAIPMRVFRHSRNAPGSVNNHVHRDIHIMLRSATAAAAAVHQSMFIFCS